MGKRADKEKAKERRRARELALDATATTVAELGPPRPAWQRFVGRLTGARVCYGKPIEAHGHVIVPVATLRTFGGLGFGGSMAEPGSPEAPSSGGGGGGFVDARPVGFIDIGPDGVRYEPIELAPSAQRAGTTTLIALALLLAARVLAVRRRPAAEARWPARSRRR